MHAAQRLTTFYFYIVISSVIATALLATFQKDHSIPRLGMLPGFLLGVFSFVFWKLDTRNKCLIKGAEAALKFFESNSEHANSSVQPHVSQIFLKEEYDTKQKRKRSIFIWKSHFSYSECFNLVFLTFGSVGILGGLLAWWF
jgi:hypothetical protein